ncbi:MAG: aldehyde ferredoxin oxidoreductase [Tindallia sp. MSAO_Bac2]|nr:MAG: aldehyde ferredoxin oxidoreductase [Tindallia sp. MSAO_Bac2]
MSEIIRIRMDDGSVTREKLSNEEIRIGGRALTSKIISEEVDPACDVFGSHNKLVFAAGPFAGTTVSCANRLSVGGKSPMTGGIKESNAGGNVAYKMGKLNLRGIVLEGIPTTKELQILYVSKDRIELVPASQYRSMPVYETADKLREEFGKKVGMAIIGPAGEQLSMAAGIGCTDNEGRPSRFAARGGIGAIMGSKGIKAVVIDDTGAKGPEIADREKFKTAQKAITQEILNNEQVAETYTKLGTPGMVNITNSMGALPTRNFSRGSFEKADEISGQKMYETIKARGGEGNTSHSCMPGCLIRCSNVYADASGKESVAPMEYETIGLMGSNCGIGDLDIIAKLNYACNDLGIDTIDMGGAIGVAMEAGLLEFGDGEGALKLMEEVRNNTPLGKILASGGQRTGEILGVRRIPACKKQIMAAYDPRAIKGLGVTYATSTMGADHTAGQTIRAELEHTNSKGQIEASRNAQVINTMIDCLGFCFFTGSGINKKFEMIVELMTAFAGSECSLEDLKEISRETLRMEKDFNIRAGLNDSDDTLPEFFYTEENPDAKTVFDISKEAMQKIFTLE